ncbi:MAG TPA: DNA alkylation repair protein [Candidatus Limnocylindria bacterium]|nr:DNA alkylation repair protein [Candidatus Limnocylindria bacterium]
MTPAQPDVALTAAVRTALTAAADPALAPGMQAYMKSDLPYFGVRLPETRRLTKACVVAHPPTDRQIWEATVRELYDRATHREERYAALVLAGHPTARAWQDLAVLPLHRHLVTTGAWWDLVDWVATRLVGPVHRSMRSDVEPVVLGWARDDDLWLRRTAVLCQVGAKDALDLNLLSACLEPNLERPEFWLRKACGWALRDASYRHPAWVRAYVSAHEERLAGLTRREATKHLG